MSARISFLLAICLLGSAFAQAASDLPKPGPGHQKMLEWCGQYDITGKTYTSPLGPAHEIKGKWIGRPILDGFAIEGTYLYDGLGPTGETEAKEVVSYDSATDKYHYLFLANKGYCEQAYFTVAGPVAAWEGTQLIDGKTYKFRGSDTDLPDGSGFVRKGELSADGTTWQPNMECRHIRVKTPESTSDEQELIRLEHELTDGYLKADAACLRRLLADDYTYGTPDGMFATKDMILGVIESADYKATSLMFDNQEVRVYGNAAVVTGLLTSEIQLMGSDMSGQSLMTDMWSKRDGRWQCVASHASRATQ
jgi:ketosteroid isomerase-like protein